MINKKNQSLELIFVKEVKNGKEVLETRKYKNLKVDAPDTAIMAVAEAIVALSEGNFKEYQLTQQSSLSR